MWSISTLRRRLWNQAPSQAPLRRPRAALRLEALDARDTPAVGGGYTAAGLLGSYFANNTILDLVSIYVARSHTIALNSNKKSRFGRIEEDV